MTEDEMVGWHHRHEFEQTLGDGEGQGNLVCCSPWGHKGSDMTERLNNNKFQAKMQGAFSLSILTEMGQTQTRCRNHSENVAR